MKTIDFEEIISAERRIKNHIKNTPIISSKEINDEFNAEIFFKMDNQQETKSFKARGAFNAVLGYFEKHKKFPEKIVVQSTGNHAQAMAFVCKKFQIPVLIYMAKTASPYKINATKALGAQVILCEKRSEANFLAEQKQQEGYFFVHPSDNDDVISGQATCALEALREIENIEAIFAPCGGGGLLAGCYLAKKEISPQTKIFGCEPLIANDAARSVKLGKIVGFEDSPKTIADGVRTLKVAKRCFHYLQKLDDILEIAEEEIIFWQKKLSKILQQKIEPTSALSMAGLAQYLQKNSNQKFQENPNKSFYKNRKFLAVISGGNVEE